MRNKDYRPVNVEFDVAHDGTNVPLSFGNFETAEDAAKFLGSNCTAINQAITAARHMDSFEKKELRVEYNDLLENILPTRENDLSKATLEFNAAKKKLSECQEMVNATVTEVKSLAYEVKRGLVDMRLDDMFTSRIPYKGRYYFFTYIDKQLKLCAIRDIPDFEKNELWNIMAVNEEFIDSNFTPETMALENAQAEA